MNISDDVGSKYRFIILSGQRVAQLQRGAKPRLAKAEKMKFTQIAMLELEEGSLNFNKKNLPPSKEGEETPNAASETPKELPIAASADKI